MYCRRLMIKLINITTILPPQKKMFIDRKMLKKLKIEICYTAFFFVPTEKKQKKKINFTLTALFHSSYLIHLGIEKALGKSKELVEQTTKYFSIGKYGVIL